MNTSDATTCTQDIEIQKNQAEVSLKLLLKVITSNIVLIECCMLNFQC